MFWLDSLIIWSAVLLFILKFYVQPKPLCLVSVLSKGQINDLHRRLIKVSLKTLRKLVSLHLSPKETIALQRIKKGIMRNTALSKATGEKDFVFCMLMRLQRKLSSQHCKSELMSLPLRWNSSKRNRQSRRCSLHKCLSTITWHHL